MKRKLTLIQSILLLLSVGSVFTAGLLLTRQALWNEAEHNVIALTHAYALAFTGDIPTFSVSSQGERLTICKEDGTVFWDSQEKAEELENHGSREEVIAALNGTPKTVARSSATFGVETLYYAETRTIQGNVWVIRVSYVTSSFTQFMTGEIPWMVGISLFAVGVSAIAIHFLTQKTLAPLREIAHHLEIVGQGGEVGELKSGDPDIEPILQGVKEVSDSLQRSMAMLQNEKESLRLVLDSVSDGILAYRGREVLFANSACLRVLPEAKGEFGDDFLAWLSQKESRIQKDGRTYLLNWGHNDHMSLLVFTDITAMEEAEAARRRFFDASSHELKTPLTSISGFSEVISLKSQDPAIVEYAKKIQREATRMGKLVSDMLRLEELEEPAKGMAPVSMAKITESVFQELAPLAESKKISLMQTGDSTLPFLPRDAVSLIKNLVENGILYNLEGGYVKVMMSPHKIVVEDNGIG
ncbi:MAG: histidine kinase dimerization/phospho-acceptor domain-containing protein, partial [Candidatus Enteromonas sp.]|nr:histidine kinase dimerization/phospho-acceptor domain-containing protein [Candidatus Enteromonas sp.]